MTIGQYDNMQYDDNIRSERARMGGDWAVCCVLLTRKIRDVVRWNFMLKNLKCSLGELDVKRSEI